MSYIFRDAKRPIMAKILGNLNFGIPARFLGILLTNVTDGTYNPLSVDLDNLIQSRNELS